MLLCLALVAVACSTQTPLIENPTSAGENSNLGLPTPNADGVFTAENEATAEAIRNPPPSLTATPLSATATPILPTPSPVPIEFRGTGDDLSAVFDLNEGLLTFSAQHGGSANFIVSILSDEGSSELGVNTIGRYSGAGVHLVASESFLGLKPGKHRLQINADGPWNIELTQPNWNGGQLPPFEWNGDGDNVIGPILLRSGVSAASFSHVGSGNFMVQLMKSDGSLSELLVNDIGAYNWRLQWYSCRKSPGRGVLGTNPGSLRVGNSGRWFLDSGI